MQHKTYAKHLTAKDYYLLIENDVEDWCGEPLVHHLTQCHECFEMLDLLLLTLAPPTLEEAEFLAQPGKQSSEQLLEQIRPMIAASAQARRRS